MNRQSKIKIWLVLAFGIWHLNSYGQVKFGSNPATVNANSLLELESTTKGLLLPRVALTATNAASPLTAHVAGMVVYNTATAGTSPNNVTPGYYYNNGTQWLKLSAVGDVYLTNTALSSSTSPAGLATGQMMYNTTAVTGPPAIPVGPVYWDGSAWQPVGADAAVGNEVLNATTNKGLTRAGSGTAVSPYTLGLTDGTATNQTMVWDGSKWAPGSAGLTTVALSSNTSPAGTNTGDMRYNTSAVTGPPAIPVGPVYWDGSAWQPVGADAAVGNEVKDSTTNGGLTRAGSGTAASPYTLGLKSGTAANQTMVWNGSRWVVGSGGLVSTALTNATTPAGTSTGQMIYNTSAVAGPPAIPVGPTYWNGTSWVPVGSASEPWYRQGTTTGATDNTDNMFAMGNIGIGINAPTNQLHVKATTNPLKLEGMTRGSLTTDSVMVITSAGVVKQLSFASAIADPTVGSVTAFAQSAIPSDYLECDGSAVSRTTYATLFAKIGTTYGAGNGTTTFNLPDLRGEFIRGWDHGRGADVSGRTLGSNQVGTLTWIDSYNDYNAHFTVPVNVSDVSAYGWNEPALGRPASTYSFRYMNFNNGVYNSGGVGAPTSSQVFNTGTQASTTITPSISASANSYPGNFFTATRPRNVAMVYAIKAKESIVLPSSTSASVVAAATSVEPWYSRTTGVGATLNTEDIYSMGKVMIGTSTIPTGGTNTKLIINNGTNNGAIQIIDGTEGAGKVLTSDANGVGTWMNATLKESDVIYATYTTPSVSAAGVAFYNYTVTNPGLYFATYYLNVNSTTLNLGYLTLGGSALINNYILDDIQNWNSFNHPQGYASTITQRLSGIVRLKAGTFSAYFNNSSLPASSVFYVRLTKIGN